MRYVYGIPVNTNLQITTERITPEVAAEMLKHNTRNRHLSSNAKANRGNIYWSMKNDAWWLNGESIKFAVDGTLLDGQHRLDACVRTNMPFTTVVVRGISEKAQALMDCGRKRTVSDVLSISGIKNSTVIAAASSIIINYSLTGEITSSAIASFSREMQINFIRTHEDKLAEAIRTVSDSLRTIAPYSPLVALAYIMMEDSSDDAKVFFRELASDNPTYQEVDALRQYLINYKLKAKKSVDRRTLGAVCIKAWNAYMNGDEIKVLRWTRGGAHPEQFPEINGMTEERRMAIIADPADALEEVF